MKVINKDEMCMVNSFKWPELEDVFSALHAEEVAVVEQGDIGEFENFKSFRVSLCVYHKGKYRTKRNPHKKVLYVWKREKG